MSNEDVVRGYFACLDAEDWDGMRALWHERCELRAVGARPAVGLDAVIDFFSRLFTPWVRHEDRPDRVLACGDTITVEVTFTGLAGDGRTLSFLAVDVIDFDGGRICSLSNWYDIAYVRRLLKPDAAIR